MVQKFVTAFQEEMAFGAFEVWAKRSLAPLVEELDRTGTLDLYLKLAADGVSIWRSALPRGIKKQARDSLAANRHNIDLIRSDPQRLIDIALDSLPAALRAKLGSVPPEYWVGQLQEILGSI